MEESAIPEIVCQIMHTCLTFRYSLSNDFNSFSVCPSSLNWKHHYNILKVIICSITLPWST